MRRVGHAALKAERVGPCSPYRVFRAIARTPVRLALMEPDRNRTVYGSQGVVASYVRRGLEPGERTILDLLRARLPSMGMLDLGVGAERTTPYFQPLVREYTAIDYSPAMIEACKRRFPDMERAFRLGDARAMTEFPAGAFDLVLFSNKGIDAVSHEDRLRALEEIARVLSPGGSFVFSSHNMKALEQLYRMRLNGGPNVLATHVVRAAGMWLLNGLRPPAGPYARIYDGTHRFRVPQYYATPEEQRRQLDEAGSTDVRVSRSKASQWQIGRRCRALRTVGSTTSAPRSARTFRRPYGVGVGRAPGCRRARLWVCASGRSSESRLTLIRCGGVTCLA